MDNLASFHLIAFGANDLKVAVGDVVKIKEGWGSYEQSHLSVRVPSLHKNYVLCKKYSLASCTELAIGVRRRGRFDGYIPGPNNTSRAPRR